MLKPIAPRSGDPITFTFNGCPVTAAAGASIASALLEAGHPAFRSSAVSGESRGPFCMMGACFECLVNVDGFDNRQACLIAARDGLDVRSQHVSRIAR